MVKKMIKFGQGGGFSQGFTDFGDLGDIFGSFFGGGFGGGGSRRSSNQPRQGQDRYMQMRIDFMDSIFGKTETISLDVDETCKHCNGSGAESPSDVQTCPTCHGSGYVMSQQRTPFGVIQQQSVCPDCHGTGKKVTRACSHCHVFLPCESLHTIRRSSSVARTSNVAYLFYFSVNSPSTTSSPE